MADAPSLQPTVPQIWEGSFPVPFALYRFSSIASSWSFFWKLDFQVQSFAELQYPYGVWLWCYHPDFAHPGEENSGQFLSRTLLLPHWNPRERFSFRDMFFQVGFLFLVTAAFYSLGWFCFNLSLEAIFPLAGTYAWSPKSSSAWWTGRFLESDQGCWKGRDYFRSRKSLETSIMPCDLRKASQKVCQKYIA